MTTQGDCFKAALLTAKDLVEQGYERVLVCHGRPIGTGGEAAGMRYWHAWVEVKLDGLWMVFDHSNGHRAELPRALYYKVGRISTDGERVQRFTFDAARMKVSQYRHWGPWVPEAEMVDGSPKAAKGTIQVEGKIPAGKEQP